jgi:heme A synthase
VINIGLFRFALAVCLSVLVLLGAGAVVATENARRVIHDWPLAFGSVLPAQHLGAPPVLFYLAVFHRFMAVLALALTAVLTIWAWNSSVSAAIRFITASALALLTVQTLLGGAEVLLQKPHFVDVLHACLAHLCLALVCCAALLMSPRWNQPPEQVYDYGWPSLRSLAIWTPALVFVQILMGALFRYHVWSIIPHILSAMFVSGVVLLSGLFVLTQFPKHQVLRKAAMAILVTMFVQIMLGVFTYISGSSASESAVPGLLPATVIVSHVMAGGILLVFTLVLGMQVRRHVLPKLVPVETMRAAS